jgi:hypothetical protein
MDMLATQLDRLEGSLPAIPARIVHFQRAVATTTYDQMSGAAQSVLDATRSILDSARISSATVTGQAKAAGADVLDTVQRSANTVVGQAKAQGRRLSATTEREVTDVLDEAIDSVEEAPGSGKPYEQWTKAELLDRAKALDIEGRYGLNKRQLIAALRSA